MYNIDKLDLEIVNLLLENGRISATEIARQIEGTSERVVRYRINRMIEENVIRVSAVVNPKALGLNIYADIWIEVESDKILEVANKLAENENVTYVASSLGETDVSIQVVAKDTEEIYRFVTEVVRKIPGVKKTVTSIVPIILKDIYQWRIPMDLIDDGDGSQAK
ncbi:MAG TPA: Lrp/AsnC family transcriptional regulator [Anaerolineales bacterium]|jgi:Lrp/AsnC family transcriptional regulator for asnA, asnC and gidA